MNCLPIFARKNLLLILSLFLLNQSPRILAQETKPVNPLTTNFSHELLPKVDRNLTSFEENRINEKIIELDTSAKEQIKLDNPDEAFSLWYEAINLSRSLGVEKELTTITQVANVAWNRQRSQDISFLQQRLLVIEQENKTTKVNRSGGDNTPIQQINPEILPLLIDAYSSLHYLDKLLEIYQQQLAIARENNEEEDIYTNLDRLGELYLAKFDYYQAQPTYEELLTIARSNENYLAESNYLQRLAEISQALVNPENSVKYKEELAIIYEQDNQLTTLSRLKIAIGNDYRDLKKAQLASDYYQQAFTLALSLEQYAIAGDALKQLGKLYQEYQQFDAALNIYQELIKIESNSYNYYGLMNTYDFIATIYTLQEDYNSALSYFQRAMTIASQLQYKEDYFQQKIIQLEGLSNN